MGQIFRTPANPQTFSVRERRPTEQQETEQLTILATF